jgi:hypothetical protein
MSGLREKSPFDEIRRLDLLGSQIHRVTDASLIGKFVLTRSNGSDVQTVQTVEAVSRCRKIFILEAVERLGVGLQNFTGLGIADPALVRPAADFVQRAQVGGDIGVAVVGADHQVIFSSELQ